MFAPGLPLYPLPGGGKTRFQPIHVEDLVSMLVAALEEDEHVGETYEIGGPETLTLRQVTDLVYEAEKKGVTIIPLPMPLARIGLTVLAPSRVPLMGADQYRSLKFDNTTAHNDVEAFGVDPAELTTLGEHLGWCDGGDDRGVAGPIRGRRRPATSDSTADQSANRSIVSTSRISRVITATEGLNTRSRSVHFKRGGSTR